MSAHRPAGAPVAELAGVPISLVNPGLSIAYCRTLARRVDAAVRGGLATEVVRRRIMRSVVECRGGMSEIEYETWVAQHQRFWQALEAAGRKG